MWVCQCHWHQPWLTGIGEHADYRQGDDWGMVYDCEKPTLMFPLKMATLLFRWSSVLRGQHVTIQAAIKRMWRTYLLPKNVSLGGVACISMYIMYVCMIIWYVCVCMCVCIYIYMYIYIDTYTHTYTLGSFARCFYRLWGFKGKWKWGHNVV